MKRTLILALVAIVIVAFAASAYAYPQYSQKTGKPCTYCHKNPSGGKELTSAGQYYKKNQKLPPAAAAKPTTKPGAKPAAKPKTKPAVKPSSKAGAGKGPSTTQQYGTSAQKQHKQMAQKQYRATHAKRYGAGPTMKHRMAKHRVRYAPLGRAPLK
jgi:hypothetical protein